MHSIQSCPICLNPQLKLEKHHILPKEYGGPEDGPLLEVCSTCHHNIHYTAEAEYVNESANYLLPEQRRRANEYVNAIKRAKQVYEQAGGGDKLKRKVIVSLPQKDLVRLHKVKAIRGFSSLEKFLLHLIRQQLDVL
jgi:hypothetical protein